MFFAFLSNLTSRNQCWTNRYYKKMELTSKSIGVNAEVESQKTFYTEERLLR
jgi:hypothetical protein